jgi:hypothetical protein
MPDRSPRFSQGWRSRPLCGSAACWCQHAQIMYYKSMLRILTIKFQAGAGARARSYLRRVNDDEACETEAYGHPPRSFAYFAGFEKVSR